MANTTPEQEIADLKAQLAALELKIRKAPSCGSTSDCCHVGYAHRHCEHCNATISLIPQIGAWQWPNTAAAQPYNPLSVTGTFVQKAAAIPSSMPAIMAAFNQIDRYDHSRSLDGDSAAPRHACEVN